MGRGGEERDEQKKSEQQRQTVFRGFHLSVSMLHKADFQLYGNNGM